MTPDETWMHYYSPDSVGKLRRRQDIVNINIESMGDTYTEFALKGTSYILVHDRNYYTSDSLYKIMDNDILGEPDYKNRLLGKYMVDKQLFRTSFKRIVLESMD